MTGKTIRLIMMSIIGISSFSMHSMFRSIMLAKRPFSAAMRGKRTFFHNTPQLRAIIADPYFSPVATQHLIDRLPQENVNGCDRNGLIEHIVFKATEYKKNEKKYAIVLSQLRKHGWTKSVCCVDVMLHSAVISDLPYVTEELLQHDPQWIRVKDLHGCVPIDYAQSPKIIQMLKDAGSSDAQSYTGEDKWYRIPDYGWQQVTPLRQAVYEGNTEKYRQILAECCEQDIMRFINAGEINMLQRMTDLRFWRTGDEKYLKIKSSLRKLDAFYCNGC